MDGESTSTLDVPPEGSSVRAVPSYDGFLGLHPGDPPSVVDLPPVTHTYNSEPKFKTKIIYTSTSLLTHLSHRTTDLFPKFRNSLPPVGLVE